MRRWICSLGIALAGALLLSAPAAQAACAIGKAGATQRVEIGRTGRAMSIHLPAGFEPSRRYPMLLLLHGSGGTGAGMLPRSGLAATADRHRFVLAAPDGGIPVDGGFVWNIPGVPTVTGKIPTANDANDVAYLADAADWLASQGCVDRARVYVTGISGGGRMASWLACVAADRYAAIAPVVGLRAGNPTPGAPQKPDPTTCRPSRPVPVIAFAGDKDETNPIAGGGRGYWQYPMRAAEQRWAELNGCAGKLATRQIAPDLYEERFGQCRAGAEVVGRIKVGGGHTWLADNDAMWAFLSRHRLP